MTEKFVFDTNALISAFLLQKSVSAQAFDHAQSVGKVIISTKLFAEFTEVFLRKKFDRYLSIERRLSIIEGLPSDAIVINVSTNLQIFRDSSDDMLLELAVDGDASCIITGDPDLLVLHPFRNISIVQPATFLQTY